ncbi:MAG: hypothetical protein AB9860_04280 [Methanomassiliicoccales archaeon]
MKMEIGRLAFSEADGRKMKLTGMFMMAHGVMHAFLLNTPRVDGGPGNFITQNGTSWLFSGLGLEASSIEVIGNALVLLSALGWIASSLGYFNVIKKVSWRNVALASSVLSLFTIAAFWNQWMVAGLVIDVVAILFLIRGTLTRTTSIDGVN